MEKIASFTVNHLTLEPGLYVSRKDRMGAETVTTFDLRMTAPNREPVMNDPDWKDRTVYFGPMGCRTGFYLLLAGDLEPRDVEELVQAMFRFIRDYEGPVPGAAARDCGNYLDMNLPMAKLLAGRYLEKTLLRLDEAHMCYPE